MNFYTEDQIRKAREVDLLSFLQKTDPNRLIRVSGNTYCLRDHDSFRISNGKWFWFSRGFGGKSALDYLTSVRNHSFLEAVNLIIGSGAGISPSTTENKRFQRVLLPAKSETSDKAKAYLQGRGIDPEIIDFCLERNLLYESRDGRNVVFVGYDDSGSPKYAALRSLISNYKGDATGSDKSYSFRWKGVIGNLHLHVFESAIDLLSYATLIKRKGFDWTRDSLLSLAGVYAVKRKGVVPKALEHFLEAYPANWIIHLHLDNDEVGKGAAAGIIKRLQGKYRLWNQPPRQGKDMNDELMKKVSESA